MIKLFIFHHCNRKQNKDQDETEHRLCLPFLPSSLGEKPQDFRVEGFHVGEGLHLHLQQVIFAKFALQVLDGTTTSGRKEEVIIEREKKT